MLKDLTVLKQQIENKQKELDVLTLRIDNVIYESKEMKKDTFMISTETIKDLKKDHEIIKSYIAMISTLPQNLADFVDKIQKAYEGHIEKREKEWRKVFQQKKLQNTRLNAELELQNKEMTELKDKIKIYQIEKAEVYISEYNKQTFSDAENSIFNENLIQKITQRSEEDEKPSKSNPLSSRFAENEKNMLIERGESDDEGKENVREDFWGKLQMQIPGRKKSMGRKKGKNGEQKQVFLSKIGQFRKMLFLDKGISRFGLKF